MYERGPKKKICEMKNKENEVQTDRNETLKICTSFDTELYSSALRDRHLHKKYQPRHFRSPTDHNIRSQEYPERN